MTTDEATVQRKTIRERLAEAAEQQMRERGELRRRVDDIVLGDDRSRSPGRRVGEFISLSDKDHVVEVLNRDGTTWWTTVYDSATDRVMWSTIDLAMLHLLAQRAGADNDMGRAAFFAARVLNIPNEEV